MPYDRPAVAAYFDQLGEGEWQRFDKYALGAVHEHIHNLYLERFIRPGSRVLEIGAGPGRFTQTLHRLGCRIVVADISDVQLPLNRRYGSERGFENSVESYEKLDICDLSPLPASSFDVRRRVWWFLELRLRTVRRRCRIVPACAEAPRRVARERDGTVGYAPSSPGGAARPASLEHEEHRRIR